MAKTTVSKRLIAKALAVLMLAMVLLSAFYTVKKASHDCSGDHCPICACLQQCRQPVACSAPKNAAHVIFAAPVFFPQSPNLSTITKIPQKTLVSSKIRLNN